MLYTLEHNTIDNIRKLRIDYFVAGSEFTRLFSKLYEALEKYAEHPKADRYTIAERNETLKGLAEFHNASEELHKFFSEVFEDTAPIYALNASDHINGISNEILNYLREQLDEAATLKNVTRVKIIMQAIENQFKIQTALHYLSAIPANTIPHTFEIEGMQFACVKPDTDK